MNYKLAGGALLMLIVFGACKKNKDNDTPSVKQQLLAKVRIEESQNISLDIDYDKDKFAEIREFSRNGKLTRNRFFSFDSRGRVASYQTAGETTQNDFTETAFFYTGEKLIAVRITGFKNGIPGVLNTIELDYDANTVSAFVNDKSGKNITVTKATYSDQGNIIQLINKNIGAGRSDTTEFGNYDSNTNSLNALLQITGNDHFIPPSKNNPGFLTQRRPPTTQTEELRYEYNAQKQPVKITSDRQTLLLEYKVL